MKKKHVVIPVFIPEMACGHQCIYCNQRKITGIHQIPSPEQISDFIKMRLKQISSEVRHIQIAFFGGSFTGIPFEKQASFLEVAQYYIDNDRVESIRLSTRPDYVDHEQLVFLQNFSVRNIELGAQSMCEEVLTLSGRGHSASDTKRAAALIKGYGFILGLQMMTGLPSDTAEKTLHTASEIIRLEAAETRIYPVLVFRDTALFDMFQNGKYLPLTIDDTIERLVPVVRLFEQAGISILRIGLHPSQDLLGGEMVAGPWHPALRQLIYTRLWSGIISEVAPKNQHLILRVSTEQFPNAVGFSRKNAADFPNVVIQADGLMKGMQYESDYC
jgi:histone acetyltransferase (RNA polymerase elongator complex component)